jgi:glycerophosphoryl diester phosphodiesterase
VAAGDSHVYGAGMRRALVLIAACGESLPEPVLCPVEAEHAATTGVFEDDTKFVAHAFGSPTGLTQGDHYSNSREAFVASYFNGFRGFEVDLMELADGTVAAVHDAFEPVYGHGKPFRESTRVELEGKKWNGLYEVLFAEDIIELMVDHPDVWVVLDTKCQFSDCDLHIARTLVELAPDDSVRDRLVPHVTGDEHAAMLPGIYPFPEMIYARYQWPNSDAAVLGRMAQYGIDNVMLGWDPTGGEWSETFQTRLDDAGYHTWVHTPDDPAQIESYPARGIGVYSNGHIACPDDAR